MQEQLEFSPKKTQHAMLQVVSQNDTVVYRHDFVTLLITCRCQTIAAGPGAPHGSGR